MIYAVVIALFILFIFSLCKASGFQEDLHMQQIERTPPSERYQFALVSTDGDLIDWCWAENVVSAKDIFSNQGRTNMRDTYVTNLSAILKGDYYE